MDEEALRSKIAKLSTLGESLELVKLNFDLENLLTLGSGNKKKRIQDIGSLLARFWSGVHIGEANECWPWKACEGHDYGSFRWGDKIANASRFAFLTTLQTIPPKMMVCHKCDFRPCCNPTHLFIGTALDNCRDRMVKGRHWSPRGSEHPFSKLTEDDVRRIRARKFTRMRECIPISRELGITHFAVWNIFKGVGWKHV